jgi:hypothetical protein
MIYGGTVMTFDEAMGHLRGLSRDQVRAYVHKRLSPVEAARFDERARDSASSEVIRIAAAQALARQRAI